MDWCGFRSSVKDGTARQRTVGRSNLTHIDFNDFETSFFQDLCYGWVAFGHHHFAVGQADGVAAVSFLRRKPNQFASFGKLAEIFGFEVPLWSEDDRVGWG